MTAAAALTVGDIIRAHGAVFAERWGARLRREQRRALEDLGACQTAALGGHVWACASCGYRHLAYNSCRNRHCPSCQGWQRARWLEREAGNLLPVEYHHVVFTLPSALAGWASANPALVYGLLFAAASASVRELAADPRYLGAEVGLVAVLHTWGQNLHHHPHLHVIASGGGLACDASGRVLEPARWRGCRRGFFLPVRVLSRLFRGKFLGGLRQAQAAGRLLPPVGRPELAAAGAFGGWLGRLYEQDWVVHSQPPVAGPEVVLKYLARYVHRVAISNERLVRLEDGQVHFTGKDYADGGRRKDLTLSAEEFLRRFIEHVLPRGFVRVRHYGLLSNRHRKEQLAECRRLLAVAVVAERVEACRPTAALVCPVCQGEVWVLVERLPADDVGAGPAPARRDTS